MDREELRAKIDDLCHVAKAEWDKATEQAKQREAEIQALNEELENG